MQFDNFLSFMDFYGLALSHGGCKLTTKQHLAVQQMQKCQTEWDILHMHQGAWNMKVGFFWKENRKT